MSKKTYEHPSVEHILASINAFEALEEGKKNLRSFYCRRQTAFSLWSLDKKKNFQFVLTPEVEINRLELKGVNVTEVT